MDLKEKSLMENQSDFKKKLLTSTCWFLQNGIAESGKKKDSSIILCPRIAGVLKQLS